VLLVVGSRFDAGAASLVRRWRPRCARLLTCEDLSTPGWSWDPQTPDRATMMVQGERLSVRSLRGVVTLLPSVTPAELPHIAEADREYVASEMTAFLLAWLSRLPCRVVNPPAPLCLSGSYLHPEQWLQIADRSGLPVQPMSRRVVSFMALRRAGPGGEPTSSERLGGADELVAVPIVGGRCIIAHSDFTLSPAFTGALERLAATTRAGLLTVTLRQMKDYFEFVSAVPAVDVTQPEIADAMLQALERTA